MTTGQSIIMLAFASAALPALGSIFAGAFGRNKTTVQHVGPSPQQIQQQIQQQQRLTNMQQSLTTQVNENKQTKKLFDKYKTDVDNERKEEADPKNFDKFDKKKFKRYTQGLEGITDQIQHKKLDEFPGVNIGCIGNTSSGKSSLMNKLAGSKVCEVGKGEVTTELSMVHEGPLFRLWDFPGKHEANSYYDYNLILILCAMTRVVVMYESSPKEVFRLLQILNALKIDYILVRSKCDLYDSDEDSFSLAEYIQRDTTFLQKKGLPTKVYSISVKNVEINDNDPDNEQEEDVFDWEEFYVEMLKQ